MQRAQNAIGKTQSTNWLRKIVYRLMRLLSSAAIIVLCSSCEEVPSYVQHLRAGVFPWAAAWRFQRVVIRLLASGHARDQTAFLLALAGTRR